MTGQEIQQQTETDFDVEAQHDGGKVSQFNSRPCTAEDRRVPKGTKSSPSQPSSLKSEDESKNVYTLNEWRRFRNRFGEKLVDLQRRRLITGQQREIGEKLYVNVRGCEADEADEAGETGNEQDPAYEIIVHSWTTQTEIDGSTKLKRNREQVSLGKKIDFTKYPSSDEGVQDARLRCRWIHLPTNNKKHLLDVIDHVEDSFRTCTGCAKDAEAQRENAMVVSEHEATFAPPKTNQNSSAPFRKSKHGFFLKKDPIQDDLRAWIRPHARENSGKVYECAHDERIKVISICLPYLHWERNITVAYINHLMQDIRTRRDGESALELSKSLKVNMPPPELHLRRGLQRGEKPDEYVRRTLDKYFHTHLNDTTERDHDQVVTKNAAKNRAIQMSHLLEGQGPVLMVDQCWMFIIGGDTVVTSFPSTWNDCTAGLKGDRYNLNDMAQRLMARLMLLEDKVQNAYDIAQAVLQWCAPSMLLTDQDHDVRVGFRALNVFDTAMNTLMDQQRSAFKALWKSASNDANKSDDLFDISAEFDMMAEVRDIKEELIMINKIVYEQINVLEELKTITRGLDSLQEIDLVAETRQRKELVEQRLTRARELEDEINNLLQLKGQRAAIAEARASRQMAIASEEQNASVMLFTVITVVFLPLSAMASIFGMNAAEFGQGDMPIGTICAYIFPVSVAFVLVFLGIGLNRDLQKCFMLVFRIASQWVLLKVPRGSLADRAKVLERIHRRLADQRRDKYAAQKSVTT